MFLGSGDRGAVVALDLGTSKTRRLDAPTSGDDTTVATLDVGTNGLYWSTTTAVRTDDGSTTYRHRLFHANEDEVVVELHGSEFDVVSGSESPSGFFFFDDEGRTSAIAFDGDGSGRLLALEQGSAETRELDDVGREASLGPYSSFLSIARRDRIFVGLKILTSGQRVLTTWSAPSVAQTSGFLTSLGEANLLPVVTESHVYWTQNGDRTTIRRSTFDARAPSASLVTVPYATDERREITVLTGGSRGLAWISMRSYSGDAAPYRLMTTIP
ncbi:MAG: hypothetical protein U0169_11145 [Polyangiaceae bacterium]